MFRKGRKCLQFEIKIWNMKHETWSTDLAQEAEHTFSIRLTNLHMSLSFWQYEQVFTNSLCNKNVGTNSYWKCCTKSHQMSVVNLWPLSIIASNFPALQSWRTCPAVVNCLRWCALTFSVMIILIHACWNTSGALSIARRMSGIVTLGPDSGVQKGGSETDDLWFKQ